MSASLRFLIALAAGAIAAAGFAPFDLWPLTIAAVAVLLALLDRAETRRGAFATGWWFGVGHFFTGLAWIAHAFTYQDAMPASLGWVAVGGLSMFLGLYPGLAALLAWSLARTSWARVLVLAAAWMLAEWLRGWVLSGFAWNPLGAAWLPVPLVPDAAAWIGAIGLSGLMVLAGGALRLAVLRHWREAGVTVLLPLAIAGLTLLRAEAPPASGPMVHIVQPDIGQEDRWNPATEERHLSRQLNLTRGALAEPARRAPAMVLWPESSVQGLVEDDPALRTRLASVLKPGDLLLFGGVALIRDASGETTAATNSLFILDAQARILGRYDKSHLVPLGEYVPARGLMTALGLARLAPGNLDFQPGPGPTTYALPGLPDVGILICYEMIFPHAVVDPKRRPAWLLQPSNDSWYGFTMQPQHLDQARLRAIEEGLPVARATPNGISALIDARGRVVASRGSRIMAVISEPLPSALPPTLFARAGHWATLAFGLLLLAAAWVVRRRI